MIHATPISQAYVIGHVAYTSQLVRISARDEIFTDYLRNFCPSSDYGTALCDWLAGWDAARTEHSLMDQ